MLKIFMFVNKKSLGQNIYNHILYVVVHQFNKTLFSFFSHQIMMNLDMLCVNTKNWVFLIKIYNFDYCHIWQHVSSMEQ
jgi:hypothetical protein